MTEKEIELRDLLRELMDWIDNWDPNFTFDPQWPETKDRVKRALGDS